MNVSGIHQGNLRMYGGFIFKQWKQRFLLLTAEGSLHVCRDASSPPDQLVWLQSHCKAIVEGKDILDLPKLPSGGLRDCCFAVILHQYKYLLLLADSAADCSQWLNVLKKVKKSVSSPLASCKRHKLPPLNIGINDLLPEQKLDPPTATASDTETTATTCASPRERGRSSPRSSSYRGGVTSSPCLRHGSINNAQAVRAVYLLMGGAAASSALGYLGACSASNLEAQAPDGSGFSGLGPAGPFHSGSPALDSPHFTSFDFDVADAADFDAFDCGGFTF